MGGHVQRDQGSDTSTFARIFPWWAKARVTSDRHVGVGTEPRLLNGNNVERASEALLLQLVHLLVEAAGDVERAVRRPGRRAGLVALGTCGEGAAAATTKTTTNAQGAALGVPTP